MEVKILNSGSNGNCTVIDDTIIIDAGWNVSPVGDIVLLTHHHTDHTEYLSNFDGLPVYCLQATADKLQEKRPYQTFNVLDSHVIHDVKGCRYYIAPWGLKHDVPCCGFSIVKSLIGADDERIFYASDFNEICASLVFIEALRNKEFDAIYIECNNTLDPTDLVDIFMCDTGTKPKDEFHRRRSYQNHCNVDYLIDLFTRAGYSETNRFTEPVTLLHKSSYYYTQNMKRIVDLCKIVNITNPMLGD